MGQGFCQLLLTPVMLAQVHCVQAYGRLLAVLQELGPFPAGLVLHSWAGSPDVTHQLATTDGVYFSVSGHLTRLRPAKARATVAAVRADGVFASRRPAVGGSPHSLRHVVQRLVCCGLYQHAPTPCADMTWASALFHHDALLG